MAMGMYAYLNHYERLLQSGISQASLRRLVQSGLNQLPLLVQVSDPDVDHWEQLERRKLLAQAQENPGWGLDFIDQRSLPLDSFYAFNETGMHMDLFMGDSIPEQCLRNEQIISFLGWKQTYWLA